MDIKRDPKETAGGCLVIGVFVLLLFFALRGCFGDSEPARPLTAEDKFKNECMIGSECFTVSYYIKNQMDLRDPESYQHISSAYLMNGDTAVVLVKFRSKNGFGGYNINSVAATVLNGNVLTAAVVR